MNPSTRARAALSLAAGLLAGSACASRDPSTGGTDAGPVAAARVKVETQRLAPRPFEDRVEATGSLEADRDATLSSRTAGTVELLQRLGARVRKGELVGRIDPGVQRSGVLQAEAARKAAVADLEIARQTFERQRPLHAEGVISDLEFRSLEARYLQAEARLAQAEAQLAQAREAVESTRVVAPFAGVVDRRFVDIGEQVSPGMRVARVVDARTLVVKAGLPERYAADIQVGASVEVRLPAYGLEPRKGTVRFVATAIDPRSRTFDVEVALDNPDGRLKPEMVAKIVVTRARVDDALVVPEDAVLRDEEGLHVFAVVEEKGQLRARRRAIDRVGRGGGMMVVRGLKAGAEVVVVGQTKLIDGDYVEVDAESAKAFDKAQANGSGDQ